MQPRRVRAVRIRVRVAVTECQARRTAWRPFRFARQPLFPSIAETVSRHFALLESRAKVDNPDDCSVRANARSRVLLEA